MFNTFVVKRVTWHEDKDLRKVQREQHFQGMWCLSSAIKKIETVQYNNI